MSDREAAEANRNILRNSLDRIPTDLRDKLLSVLEETEQTQQSFNVFMDFSAKDAERHVQEIIFMETQIKGLLQAIRATAIAALRATAKETIERIRERKRQEELKRWPCCTRWRLLLRGRRLLRIGMNQP